MAPLREPPSSVIRLAGSEYRLYERLHGGCNSRVHRVEHDLEGLTHLTVLKKIRPHHAARHTTDFDEAACKAAADEIVETASVLRASWELRARFEDIVPETMSPAPGYLLTAMAKGVGYQTLGSTQRRTAASDYEAMRKIAKRLLPDYNVSNNLDNATFDPRTGRIVCWFDHLAHRSKPPRKDRVRK
jgi:hypothetical protein